MSKEPKYDPYRDDLKRYATIVADPPWDYAPKRGKHEYAKRAGDYYTGGVSTLSLPYPPMSPDAIRTLPIGVLAALDARVFLWTTNSHLPDAFGVLSAWGFRYSQTLVWHKPNASPFTGSVAFGSAEFLLVASRGSVPVLGKATSSVVKIGHHHDHSRKPEAFLDLVEQVSPGPYLEMFSRRARLGWDTWGDEALHGTELVA